MDLKIAVSLSGYMVIENRNRYNIWDLLADVGGFHDGLMIIGTILVSSYASLVFKKDYLDGTLVENTTDKRT